MGDIANGPAGLALSPAFWSLAWEDFLKKNRPAEYTRSYDCTERWNRRARNYGRHEGGTGGNRRLKKVLEFLGGAGVLEAPCRILDIGSGPGSFAIPFAGAGHTVVALDPAKRMLETLKERMPAESAHLVSTVVAQWEEMDIAAMGWEKSFDLVFASMTPGVRDLDTIEKMIRCSRRWCYLGSFAGQRRYLLYEEIWPELFGEDFTNHVNDIIFPFNILYALGFKPELTFMDMSQEREDTVEDLSEDVLDRAAGLGKEGETFEARLRGLLEARAREGKIRHLVASSIGMMLWQVQED